MSPDASGESVYTRKGIIPIYRDESLTLRMKEEKFFVYILQSLKDFSFYVGQCDDLDYRVSKNNEGMSKYTASKMPWRLVYFEVFESRSEALKRERQIKNMKSKIYLQNLIANWKVVRVVE